MEFAALGKNALVGIAVSILIAAVGLILALAVHPAHPGSVDVNTVGWILFLVGLVAFVLDLVLWSSWGPAYLRRRTYVEGGYTTRRVAYPARRRTVVDEVEDPAAPPPGY